MPIIEILEENLTAMSEESGLVTHHFCTPLLGELALSLLTSAQNPQTRGDIKATNKLWQQVRLMYETRQSSRSRVADMSISLVCLEIINLLFVR